MISHGKRWKYAFRAFFSLIFHGRIADDILADFATPQAAPAAPAPAAPPPVETSDRATQLLAILQRDGRLVDFLMEDLAAYQDAQVGAAVRDVHRGCREALDKYASLAPVLDLRRGQHRDRRARQRTGAHQGRRQRRRRSAVSRRPPPSRLGGGAARPCRRCPRPAAPSSLPPKSKSPDRDPRGTTVSSSASISARPTAP